MPNYNNIAWIYDSLAKVVFGSKQNLARKAFLEQIPDNAKVLIVGGGTGKIINLLRDLNRSLNIDFVEMSSKMMCYAEKRNASQLKINFYQQSILEFENSDYDIILTNFFFDQFSQDQASLILQHLKPKLRQEGMLFFSDFINSNRLQDKLITRLMFLFFQLTANIRTSAFPQYSSLFSSLGFHAGPAKKISHNILAATYFLEPPNLSWPSRITYYM